MAGFLRPFMRHGKEFRLNVQIIRETIMSKIRRKS